MIFYSSSEASMWRIFCIWYGSVLPRTIPSSVCYALMAFAYEWSGVAGDDSALIVNPYALQVLGTVLGWILVQRSNLAYNRWWEARSAIESMQARWAHTALQITHFEQASTLIDAPYFRARIVHLFSVLHAVSMADLRMDWRFVEPTQTVLSKCPYGLAYGTDGELQLAPARDAASSPTRASSSRTQSPSPAACGTAARNGFCRALACGAKANERAPRGIECSDSRERSAVALSAARTADGVHEPKQSSRLPVGVRVGCGAGCDAPPLPAASERLALDAASVAAPASAPDAGAPELRDGCGTRPWNASERARTRRQAVLQLATAQRLDASSVPLSERHSVTPTRLAPTAPTRLAPTAPTRLAPTAAASTEADVHDRTHERARARCAVASVACGVSMAAIEPCASSLSDLPPLPETPKARAVAARPVARDRRRSAGVPTTSMREAQEESGLSPARFALTAMLYVFHPAAFREQALSNAFAVIGGLSVAERRALASTHSRDRPFLVQSWIVSLMVERVEQGGLPVGAPLLARTYQLLSDGHDQLSHAAKVAQTPFPFPWVQIISLLLHVFNLLSPLFVAAMINRLTESGITSLVVVSAMTFFVTLGYSSLNQVARELEEPYGHGPNHLPLVMLHQAFNERLIHLLHFDAQRAVPDDPLLGHGTGALPDAEKQRRRNAFGAQTARALARRTLDTVELGKQQRDMLRAKSSSIMPHRNRTFVKTT